MEEEAQDYILSCIVCLLKSHELLVQKVNNLPDIENSDIDRIMREKLFRIEAALSFLEALPLDQQVMPKDFLKLN